ncbi:MAG: phenylalanine--tRNA ligase subunit alpha [bacterium]|nr:phenylalanine--tRNA ligase subunit alpha [bacterium]
MSRLEELKSKCETALQNADTVSGIEDVRISYLGKKGVLTDILKGLKDLSNEEKASVGQAANQIKTQITDAIDAKRHALERDEMNAKLVSDTVDVSAPGVGRGSGASHPLHRMEKLIVECLGRIGFSTVSGPEIETEFNNFEALNIPASHPARDMHDTFYMKDGGVLRTHTSPVQIRAMQTMAPPLRILAPGKVFRCDADVSHSPVFHQIEGLLVDKHVSFAELKGTLEFFLRSLFGDSKKVRFRPSYFPFTVPSCEVDLECVMCKGKGCGICKQTGWLEVMGAGMVHRNVFKAVGYDPEEVTGFAFGLGVDRLAMLYYQISDIRLLYENDARFISQFKGAA